MMDNFSEQLVKRQRTSSDNVRRTIVIFGGIAITLLLLVVSIAFIGSLISILGFLLAMVLFTGLRSRIDESRVPAPFRGLAVTLIAASFISLAFMGFAGVVDALFA